MYCVDSVKSLVRKDVWSSGAFLLKFLVVLQCVLLLLCGGFNLYGSEGSPKIWLPIKAKKEETGVLWCKGMSGKAVKEAEQWAYELKREIEGERWASECDREVQWAEKKRASRKRNSSNCW